MKERPILFNGSMVRAILSGAKTQTRRICTIPWRGSKRAPPQFLGGAGEEHDPSCWGYAFDGPDHHGYMVLARGMDERHDHGRISMPCPYGEPGDRLWVRETWCLAHPDYHSEEEGRRLGRPIQDGRWCHYAATDDVDMSDGPGWRPSIHMPRWASRITLEVVSVRVERLQAITEEDARAEGVESRHAFALLWDSLRPGSWTDDPWVWVVEFRRVAGGEVDGG